MKKKLLSLLLCAQIVFNVLLPLLTLAVNSAEDPSKLSAAPSSNNSAQQINTTFKSIFPDSELVWKSFRDFMVDQARIAWNYPANYVGYEVSFSPYWDSLICRSGVSGGEDNVYVSISDQVKNQLTINPNEVKLVIEDYYFEEATEYLWYKVKAADGYTLPQVLAENPYILHLECQVLADGDIDYVPPTFFIAPLKAIVKPDLDTVSFNDLPIDATAETIVDSSLLPPVFDVIPTYHNGPNGEVIWDDYNLGTLAAEYTEYSYVSQSSLMIIPVEASAVYEQLMSAQDTYEYYDIISKTPTEVKAQFSEAHKTELDTRIEDLVELEQVKYETSVNLGGKILPLSVVGKLPNNVTLQTSVVSADTVISEGFDIESASDIITALDIKLIQNEDGTEWQPLPGRRVYVSIGVGVLGYEDGTILRMQHKHDENIDSLDILMVEDGAVTIATNGFSIYVVSSTTNTNVTGATEILSGSTITLEVGQEVIYYVRPRNNNNYVTPSVSTWAITDTQGAIHYTVHANGNPGHDGIAVRWLKIDTLKETTDIKLVFNYRYNNQTYSETYTLNVVAPKADAGKKKLYLKDDVNKTGRLIATLVDDNGNEITNGLDGAAFSWKRSDGYFIVPAAYKDGYKSVNIARDHGGLVEARKADGKYTPTTYTLTAILSDGTELTADYTVYYQSEIINASFEAPGATNSNYTFFPNGWPELYWETTAPGTNENISKDIEYGDVTNGTANGNGGTDFGVIRAADHATGGVQFAELNAEAFGSLYQDIITAPGEDIEWDIFHAPRRQQDWATDITNRMYIIIGATEDAQKLTTQQQLQELGALAKQAGLNTDGDPGGPVEVTYNGAKYAVCYHDAGTIGQNQGQNNGGIYTQTQDYGWTKLIGSYTVPEGQYRTRIFFVSDPPSGSNSPNAGNLIDKARAGQYKKYLIEYYEETFENGVKQMVHKDTYDEIGEEIIYSSAKITNLDHFIKTENDYLHMILINGNNYPYNIRYSGDASLYIEKYPGKAEYPISNGVPKNNYDEFDIVMQIFIRDTVIAVQKELVFPSTLTEEQKLTLMDNLPEGYKATFLLTSTTQASFDAEEGSATIKYRDPMGKYTGYISLGENPSLENKYVVEEIYTTPLVGLELDAVAYITRTYKYGEAQSAVNTLYDSIKVSTGVPLKTSEIHLKAEEKIAEITATNTYREKQTTIYYEAVGNGKLKFIGGKEFIDKPSESLLFYSGKAKGAEVHAGVGASFVGWFKDEACTIPVTSADGVWDKETGSFKPNANIIAAEEITFYAKFETGSITINRQNANPGQTFVYHITSNATNGNKVDMYINLECDENGNGSVSVFEVPLGFTYTVTECEDWSWRHDGNSFNQENSGTKKKLTFQFDNTPSDSQWLNGYSPSEKNIFD